MNNQENNSKWKQLQDDFGYDQKLVWDNISDEEKKDVFSFNEEYKRFLDVSKTERQSVFEVIKQAEEAGFVSLKTIISQGKKPAIGDKVYIEAKEKNVALVVIGKNDLTEGLNLIGSHIDAPRLDLKPSPLYEDQGISLFKTHYYGGIKKYQWLAHPLALHGVVIKQTGEKVTINIGEADDDPILVITDLLPHLAKEQIQKKLGEAVSGEALNVLVGTLPFEEKEAKERVKLAVLKLLNDKYGIKEEDFISAELEIVPASSARDVGLDRSLVGAYGQDDRVCAYTSLKAILDCENPVRTAMSLYVDKEEIGSTGNTGMRSRFFENTVAELLYYMNGEYNELNLRKALANSRALSADVTAAVDPNWEGVHDKFNAARLGRGVVISKYTGAGGKYSTSDANAEFVAYVRKIFNQNNVIWQTGELGKVDQGGGGTIAQFIAKYGMEVLDCGPAILGMHSPVEVSHKADVYMCYKAYNVFLKSS